MKIIMPECNNSSSSQDRSPGFGYCLASPFQSSQSLGPTTYGFGAFPSPTNESTGVSPFAAPTSVSSTFGSGPFGGSTTTQASVQANASSTSPSFIFPSPPFGLTPPPPSTLASTQAPVQASATNTSSPFSFGPTQGLGRNLPLSSVGPLPAPPGNPFNSGFGPSSDPFEPKQTTTRSVFDATNEQGSKYPPYAPTPDTSDQNAYGSKPPLIISISASLPYLHQSHEEIRWNDYQKGIGKLKPGCSGFTGFTQNPLFPPSPSLFDRPQRNLFSTPGTQQGNMNTPAASPFAQTNGGFNTFNSGAQRNYPSPYNTFPYHPSPYNTFPPAGNTAPVSRSGPQPYFHQRPPHVTTHVGCTACGATTSSFSPWYNNNNNNNNNVPVNGAAPATSFQPLFFPASGSYPVMFGGNHGVQGITNGAQVATPAVQAYVANGCIVLPFAAMSLH